MSNDDVLRLVRMREACRNGAAKRQRELAGLTQAEIADSIGASREAVSRWEAGHRVPRGRVALRYARLLESLALVTGDNSAA